MVAVLGQLEPLPGAAYYGTMSTADIYPTTAPGVIGGIRTQDRALPAFGEAAVTAANRAAGVGQLPGSLLSHRGMAIIVLVAILWLARVKV